MPLGAALLELRECAARLALPEVRACLLPLPQPQSVLAIVLSDWCDNWPCHSPKFSKGLCINYHFRCT